MGTKAKVEIGKADLVLILKAVDQIVGSLDNISRAKRDETEALASELFRYFTEDRPALKLAKARRLLHACFDSELNDKGSSELEDILADQKYWMP